MHLHPFLPPPHILGFVLTAGLAFAAGALLMGRRGVYAAGTHLKSRYCSWRGDNGRADNGRGENNGFGARFASMFSKSATTRIERWNSTGNAAFEAYRSATLTELEQEAAAFRKYLDELRHAKDKSEFDAFLEERRRTPANETSSP